jgi:hypothetical protein
MPDELATTMPPPGGNPENMGKAGPALSATSDSPVFAAVDAKTETAKTGDTAPVKTGAGEATDSPDESGEGSDTPAWFKARISREENRRKAAEERAAKAEATVSELAKAIPKPAEPKAPAAEPRPTRDTFTDPDAYDAALIDWSAKQAEAATRARVEAERTQGDQKAAAEKLMSDYGARKTEFIKDHADFDDVAGSDDLTITVPMAHAIMSAEDGPALAYHLGKNPEVAKRIAALPPAAAIIELGKLSVRLSSTPTPVKADPISPVRSRNSAGPKSADEESMEEYAARRLTQLRAERRPFVSRPN